MTKQSVLIVGGGIIGSTAAFYLAKAGHPVQVFDQETGQATRAAAGIISPWLSQRRNTEWYQLVAAGARFYPTLLADLGTVPDDMYRKTGTLLFKKNQKTLDKVEALARKRRQTAPEIGTIQRLSPAEIKEMFPLLEPRSEALFISGGARVDGDLLIATLREKAAHYGAQFQKETVTKIKWQEGRWHLETASKDTATSPTLLLTPGPGLNDLLADFSLKVDLRPQKGQLACLSLPDFPGTAHYPVVMPQMEADIIPFAHGEIRIGATHENERGADLTVDLEQVQSLVESIRPLAPILADTPITQVKVGTRAFTSDYLPFFGRQLLPNGASFYTAAGLGSSGLTSGPFIGHWLAHDLQQKEPADRTDFLPQLVPSRYLHPIFDEK